MIKDLKKQIKALEDAISKAKEIKVKTDKEIIDIKKS